MDGGTLFQLRNLLNRRNVTKNPTSNVSACEDFFIHVVEAHIVSACMTVFGMSSLHDAPSSEFLPDTPSQEDTIHTRRVLLDAVKKVMDTYVHLSFNEPESQNEHGGCDSNRPHDHILEYASDVLTLGLLYMEFVDGIHEGDGERILRCWRYFLLLFRATGRKNYAVEAFTLLTQYHFLYTERMQMQLLWSRTVNIHGRQGKNVPCDLHMEHLNRECKGSISGLGANITDNAIKRVGKSLRSSSKILENFDALNAISPQSGYHTVRSSEADIAKLLKQLHEDAHVFSYIPRRKHRNFPNFTSNALKNLSTQKLLEWFRGRLRELLMYH